MNNKSLVKKCFIVISALVIPIFYYVKDPAFFHFGLPCLFKALTGWDCWGCGGQRAFHQLLHGNYQTAFHLNALIFPVGLLLGYIAIIEMVQQKPSYSWFHNRGIRLSTAVLVIGFTILRNI